MRIPRLIAVVLAAGALALTAQGTDAQRNQGTLHTLIEALNAEDAVGVQAHLASDFTLTFTGGTTSTGTEAVHMLMLLDTPITIVSGTPAGMQRGSAQINFGSGTPTYTLSFTGARGGKFASITIEAPATPD